MSSTIRNVLIGVAIAVVAVGVWYLVKPNGSPVPSERQFVNVLTGELREFPKKQIISIPERDAEGRGVFYPVEREDGGEVIIDPRYQSHLKGQLDRGDLQASELKIDPSTYKVL